MNKCMNCQHINEENASFCEECGTPLNPEVQPLNQEEPSDTNTSTENTFNTNEPHYSKPLTKKNKIFILTGCLLVILFAATFSFGKNYYSKENQIDRFIAALSTEKVKPIQNAVSSAEPNFKITEDNIVPYVEYLKSHKKYISTVANELKTSNQSADIIVEKKGSYFLFFDKYEFNLVPLYVDITTNQDDAVIKMNSEVIIEKAEADTNMEIGPLVPGEYEFEGAATINKKPVSIKQTKDLSLYNEDLDNLVSLDIQVVGLHLSTNVNSGEVYIDGEKIGDIDKASEFNIDELAYNDGMRLQIKYPVGDEVLTTEEVLLAHYFDYSDDSINIRNLDFDILTSDEAESFMNDFYLSMSYEMRYSEETQSFDKVSFSEFFKDGTSSAMYQDFADYVKTYKAKDSLYQTVSFDTIDSLVMTAENTYEISYSVDYTTNYSDYEKDTVYQTLHYSKVTLFQDEDGDLKLVNDGGADNVSVEDY